MSAFITKVWDRIGVIIFNFFGTHIPFHAVRLGMLRMWGAKIGKDTAVFRQTTVLGIDNLVIGEGTTIGWRCLLDARGGLTIGNSVSIASDVHFIAGGHYPNSDDFGYYLAPIVVDDHAWITSRSTVIAPSHIGRGAVVAASSLVNRDIPEMTIFGGIPAKQLGERESELAYQPYYKPWFH